MSNKKRDRQTPKKMKPPRLNPCKQCPFAEDGINLDPDYFAEMQVYLIDGQNHFCHTDRSDKRICRGGRNYQLEMWCRIGRIKSPTDEALKNAMIEAGMIPGEHI